MSQFLLEGDIALSPSDAAVALIIVDDKYLMQLRDDKPGIFYPGHWGVFGGAIERGETSEDALRRELEEELGLDDFAARFFTRFVIDFSYAGQRPADVVRHYYEVRLDAAKVDSLTLREGREMRAYSARAITSMAGIVPYDSLAVWMHASQGSVRLTSPHEQV